MKKLATLFAMLFVGLGTAWAQGTIAFNNSHTYPLSVRDAGGTTTIIGAPGSPLGPASVRVGLWVGPNGSTDVSQMTFIGLATNSAGSLTIFQGAFSGGNPFTITPSVPNSQVAFAFAAWSISTGALTYQDALIAPQGYYTQTPSFGQNYTLGGFGTPASLPADTFGPGAGQLPGLTLVPVPEPSTIVLGLLGAAALLLRRRK